MGRRVLAWILLAGFLLLILNIIVIGYQRMLSIAVYMVVALSFVFTNKLRKEKTPEKEEGGESK